MKLTTMLQAIIDNSYEYQLIWLISICVLVLLCISLIIYMFTKADKVKNSNISAELPLYGEVNIHSALSSLDNKTEDSKKEKKTLWIDDTVMEETCPDIEENSMQNEINHEESINIPRHNRDNKDIKQKNTPKKKKQKNLKTSPKMSEEIERLQNIERKLIAIRELHDAGLVATEIYVIKTREFAQEI